MTPDKRGLGETGLILFNHRPQFAPVGPSAFNNPSAEFREKRAGVRREGKNGFFVPV